MCARQMRAVQIQKSTVRHACRRTCWGWTGGGTASTFRHMYPAPTSCSSSWMALLLCGSSTPSSMPRSDPPPARQAQPGQQKAVEQASLFATHPHTHCSAGRTHPPGGGAHPSARTQHVRRGPPRACAPLQQPTARAPKPARASTHAHAQRRASTSPSQTATCAHLGRLPCYDSHAIQAYIFSVIHEMMVFGGKSSAYAPLGCLPYFQSPVIKKACALGVVHTCQITEGGWPTHRGLSFFTGTALRRAQIFRLVHEMY